MPPADQLLPMTVIVDGAWPGLLLAGAFNLLLTQHITAQDPLDILILMQVGNGVPACGLIRL